MANNRFRRIRIFVLMSILAATALYNFEQRRASTSWYKTIEIVIYPINGDGSQLVDSYINRLSDQDFASIDQFLAGEAARYNLLLSRPARTRLGQTVRVLPPSPPAPGSGILQVMLWSMKFRHWAWQNTPDAKSNLRRARMFVLYHEPREGRQLDHSYGLNKGLLGYVNAFASTEQQGQNNIVIAHEFLHTVGATDKYGPNGEPIFPIGFASPDRANPYEQTHAEIMAGRYPVSETDSRMPDDLKGCVIGKETALEINWWKPD